MQVAEYISIAFRLINFGALIALGVYLFKRHVLSSIQLHIAKREQKLVDLSLQNHLLKEQAKAMESNLADQRTVSHQLLQKIDLWSTLVAQYAQEREQEKNSYEQALVRKMILQSNCIEIHDAQRKALLPAIEQARAELKRHYEAESLGRSFITEIVVHMEKSKL